MKKLLYLLIFICLIVLPVNNASGQQYVCGDANGDDEVNVSDAVYIINYIFVGGDPPMPLESGDVNCDLTCNVSDAVWIINYIFVSFFNPCDLYGDGILDCDPNCPWTVTDIDGNVYQTVLIGDQCWMAENLKVIHYCNGDPIPNVTDSSSWTDDSIGAYCNYDNDEGHVATYGRLYNWYAVDDSRNIAPEGWHVPTDAEWKQLEIHLGMSQVEADAAGARGTDEGGKLKEVGTTHWNPPNTGATDESGFTALPGGWREDNNNFVFMSSHAFFLSSTEYMGWSVWCRCLLDDISQVCRFDYGKIGGLSIRCVKD
jgi:uncharacterized protein (TIGR02145 family)